MTSADLETQGKEDSKVLPTVSTYIPMLVPGSPFQISIHSWTAPQVSGNIEQGSVAMIEARLFIDGVPITLVDKSTPDTYMALANTNAADEILVMLFLLHLLVGQWLLVSKELNVIPL